MYYYFLRICVGVIVQPSVSNILVTEGGQAMVCIELIAGNLQRNVSVRAFIISSPASTGMINMIFKNLTTWDTTKPTIYILCYNALLDS